MSGLFAGLFKALGSLLGSGAGSSTSGALSTLSSLKGLPAQQNYANLGVDSNAWTPAATSANVPQVNSPSIGSLIGASLANSGRGGKGRQASEQMSQAFAQAPDMSQPMNPMSFLQQIQNLQQLQRQQQLPYAIPSSLIQYMLQLNNRGQ